jgi:hypothetical protein
MKKALNNIRKFMDENLVQKAKDELFDHLATEWKVNYSSLNHDLCNYVVPEWRKRLWVNELTARSGKEVTIEYLFPEPVETSNETLTPVEVSK